MANSSAEQKKITNQRLPATVIRRIVRENFGVFKDCYAHALKSNPQLEGVVFTRFVITRDGSVTEAHDAGSDLPDAEVTQCVIDAFSTLQFPQPEGGIVTVTYPIKFSPG